ncbi:hypothetical protein [uncultured Clostridium sp.]|jgi:ribosomal protein L25 (general stress protein Ctc)|uniref:hypothetical protein n=1 Tax=uncultured Clostridium sp. TaxID=59620 RepID=UPI00261CE2B2|nr:hypothetical protein [uncultured Clostridium sp.]
MKLELRDVKINCKRLRKSNLATGSLKKDGQVIPISIKGSDIDKYAKESGIKKNITLEFEGNQIEVKVVKVEKEPIAHNIINIDFEAIV